MLLLLAKLEGLSRDSRSAAKPRASLQIRNNPLRFAKHFSTIMADSASRFGFVAFAETWNGRLAMMGFVIGLATEVLTGQNILSQIGLG
jgi:Chlorophyll A-B binding protein